MKRKLLLSFFTILICCSIVAQNTNSLCCEDAGYVEIEKALANPEVVVALDLSLQDPKLTTVSEQISKFTNLKCLDVSYNRIGNIHPSFKNLKNIQCLDLSGNLHLQNLPEFLNEMPGLKVIKLQDLNWNENKKEQITKQFPTIQFIW